MATGTASSVGGGVLGGLDLVGASVGLAGGGSEGSVGVREDDGL